MARTALVLAATLGVAGAFQPMSMVFGGKKGGAAPAKSTKAAGPPAYLRETDVGSGTVGEWFVREDPTLSTALPWITKPTIGDGELVGDFGFDPFGLSKTFDISWLRAAELKHGRVCMLAAVGLVAPELVQHPVGFDGFSFPAEFSQMNAFAALDSVPKFGLAQIILACGLIEVSTFGSNYASDYGFDDGLSALERANLKANQRTFLTGAAKTTNNVNADAAIGYEKPEDVSAGNLGFDPLGFAAAGVRSDYALAEIKHARLAMIGVAGMLAGQFYEPSKGVLQQTLEWAQAQA